MNILLLTHSWVMVSVFLFCANLDTIQWWTGDGRVLAAVHIISLHYFVAKYTKRKNILKIGHQILMFVHLSKTIFLFQVRSLGKQGINFDQFQWWSLRIEWVSMRCECIIIIERELNEEREVVNVYYSSEISFLIKWCL